MAAVLLSDEDRVTRLPALGEAGWGAVPDRDAIRKIWKFRSFSEAWGFMSRAALVAEKLRNSESASTGRASPGPRVPATTSTNGSPSR